MTMQCKAKDPSTCRYHGQRNILTDLREEADQAAQDGNAEEYLKLKERADRIERTFAEAEERTIADSERNIHINGLTSENEITNSIRAADTAEQVIEQAFRDYNASTYAEKEEALKAQLLISDNKSVATALFDAEGNMLPAKLLPVTNNYTGQTDYVWGILDSPDPKSNVKEWFRPSKAKNEKTAKANNHKKGYYVGMVLKPARIRRATHSTLAGATSWPEIVPDWETRYDSEEILILDNGQNTEE